MFDEDFTASFRHRADVNEIEMLLKAWEAIKRWELELGNGYDEFLEQSMIKTIREYLDVYGRTE